jgi:hypothetical protein
MNKRNQNLGKNCKKIVQINELTRGKMLIGTEFGLDNDCTKTSKQKLCTRLAATREVSGRKELKMREGGWLGGTP